MTTKLFVPEHDDLERYDTPGAIWEITFDRSNTGPGSYWESLSDHYKTVHADHRPPLAVVLPSGEYWVIDSIAANGDGWEITGEFPNITARPSVASLGYHGWLTDGVLSDDMEGRTYGEGNEP